MADLKCLVVTPEETALEEMADFVALPLYDGEIGIAPGRGPMIGRLGCGEMRLRVGDKTRHYYLDGGFVQVGQNEVAVLTEQAIPAERIDEAEARKRLSAALAAPGNTSTLREARDRAQSQARAQLRVARRAH